MKAKLMLLLAMSMTLTAQTLPPDAEALRAKRDAKVAEINQLYATALEKLMRKAMAEGNIDAAKALEDEMHAAAPDPFEEKPSLTGKWRRDTDGLVFEFKDESTGVFDGSTPFKIGQVSPSGVMRLRSSQWTDTVTKTPDPHVLTGKNSNGAPYTLTRVR